ncbi:MAG: SUMF1/EgtB/PvdO family nonheme iron enzyme [Anaerolineales bacterium]
MGHIFISYNHKDAEYARKLADSLRKRGFDVWIDDVIEYGSEWPLELQEHLDNCEQLLVIMTPASFQSKWVQNELNRAMRKNKPVFPLLLEGDEPWLSVEATQYTDVRGGKLPPEKFYELLKNPVASTRQVQPGPEPQNPPTSFRVSPTTILIFVLFALVAAAAFWGAQALIGSPEPTAVVPPTFTSSAPFTPVPSPTSIEAPVLTAVPLSDNLPGVGSEFSWPQDGMIGLYIPAGTFMMGSDNGSDDEGPSHEVTLAAYWIDKTEVTNSMYRQCVDQGRCKPPRDPEYYSANNYADHPVVYVDWEDAQRYCEWAGRRLPTEAEWENAARGPSGNLLPWAGSLDCLHANYGSCAGEAKAVGSYPQGKSAYGALDMFGNVWEWVFDKYDANYYKLSVSVDPAGPVSGKHNILRGAAWDTLDALKLRLTFRYNRDPNSTGGSYGFRCAAPAVP